MPITSLSLPNYLASLPQESAGLCANCQVWLFQSALPIQDYILNLIDAELEQFLAAWDSHGEVLQARRYWLFAQVLLIVAPNFPASGCAKDRLFQEIKKLDNRYNLGLLDRGNLLIWSAGTLRTVRVSDISQVENGYFFDNSVHTWGEFQSSWLKPIANSYLSERIMS